jgi:hypothetical protein
MLTGHLIKVALLACPLGLPLVTGAQLSMVKIADLPEHLHETSGLVLYDEKYLLTHNDGGNKSELFVLGLDGSLKETIDIEDVENEDWEDLTQDDEGHVFIGDFGNNLNRRENCKIYKLPKDLIGQDEVSAKKITFTYEDQNDFPPDEDELNFDCEAFFWKDDSLYLFTKCRTKPFTGITNVYVLPDEPGKHVARKIGSIQLCSTNWQFCSVTAADYHPRLKTLVLMTYSKIYLISDFPGHQFWKGKLVEYPITVLRQREAICFKSKNSWYVTDEFRRGFGGGNLYEVKLK